MLRRNTHPRSPSSKKPDRSCGLQRGFGDFLRLADIFVRHAGKRRCWRSPRRRAFSTSFRLGELALQFISSASSTLTDSHNAATRFSCVPTPTTTVRPLRERLTPCGLLKGLHLIAELSAENTHSGGSTLYRFDVSLMERLSKAGYKVSTTPWHRGMRSTAAETSLLFRQRSQMSALEVQRRMRPAISNLVRYVFGRLQASSHPFHEADDALTADKPSTRAFKTTTSSTTTPTSVAWRRTSFSWTIRIVKARTAGPTRRSGMVTRSR